jgi:hypothetical protein
MATQHILKGKPFTSPYDNRKALEWLCEYRKRNEALQTHFVGTLVTKAMRYEASVKQWAWIHFLVKEQEEQQQAPVQQHRMPEPKMQVRPTRKQLQAQAEAQDVQATQAQQLAGALCRLFGRKESVMAVQDVLSLSAGKPDKIRKWQQVLKVLEQWAQEH